jgi:hypothetical protein
MLTVTRLRPPSKRRQAAASALAFLVVAGGALGIVAFLSTVTGGDTVVATNEPLGAGTAGVAAHQWVHGQTVTVPAATPTIRDLLEREPVEDNDEPVDPATIQWDSWFLVADPPQGWRVETHRFSVATSGRPTRILSVTVGQKTSKPGWVLVDIPSVAPAATGSGDPSQLPGVGWSVTDGAERQIAAWASAYGIGDADAVYRLTGDTADVHYLTLGGYDGADVTVVAATADEAETAATIRVRVEFTDSTTGESVNSSYDLLVTGLDRPLPFVADWGPVGVPLATGRLALAGAAPSATTPTTSTTTTVVASTGPTGDEPAEPTTTTAVGEGQ